MWADVQYSIDTIASDLMDEPELYHHVEEYSG